MNNLYMVRSYLRQVEERLIHADAKESLVCMKTGTPPEEPYTRLDAEDALSIAQQVYSACRSLHGEI
ncbi:MAG: hypothetical protein NXY59_01595 [Aigarchaeota archaeon]|nr:hypothetical protein [Candidatus Pelearchaeum maunauluense]